MLFKPGKIAQNICNMWCLRIKNTLRCIQEEDHQRLEKISFGNSFLVFVYTKKILTIAHILCISDTGHVFVQNSPILNKLSFASNSESQSNVFQVQTLVNISRRYFSVASKRHSHTDEVKRKRYAHIVCAICLLYDYVRFSFVLLRLR